MGAGDYDGEIIRPRRTERKAVCPAETGLLGNLDGMGKRPENVGFEYTVYEINGTSRVEERLEGYGIHADD